jgi:hypothetical protein
MNPIPMSNTGIVQRRWLSVLFAVVLAGSVSQAHAAKPDKVAQAGKERLVLMPLRAGKEDQNMQGAMETALVQGLQKRYEVFAGEDVAQKAREIFKRESRIAKKECDETRCMEDIAIAFQSELIATANVTRIEGGYLLALSIRNVMDNKAVFSNSLPCRDCDAFQVVDALKGLGDAPAEGATPQAEYPANGTGSDATEQSQPRAQAVEDVPEDEKKAWQVAQDRHSVSAVQAYLDKYPNGRYVAAAKSRLKSLREEETAAQKTPPVSADERLRQAEAASKAKDVSPIRAIPQYLEKVIPELIKHKRDAD